MLAVHGLSKSFGNVHALTDFSIRVRDGEAVGLVGPNGAGKTTALRCIAGIMRPDRATITIGGHDLHRDPVAAKSVLGFVPEIPYPYPHLTVWEHALFIARVFQIPGWETKAERLLKLFDLTEKRDAYTAALSKGMKQKVMLLMAFLHEPTVLLLDEPLYGIDPRGSHSLKALVRERLAAGASVLISSHAMSLIEEVCGSVSIMTRGRIIASGTKAELRERAAAPQGANLEEIFVKLTEE